MSDFVEIRHTPVPCLPVFANATILFRLYFYERCYKNKGMVKCLTMKTIQDDIKSNSFKQIYLLYGEEWYLVNQYKKKLITAITGDNSFNLTVVGEKPDWDEIGSVAETMPFMAEHRVIIFDRCNLLKKKDERAFEFFDKELPDHLIVIIAEESADKRLSLFNLVKKKGYVCELGTQSRSDVIKFINARCADEGKCIDKDAADEIYLRTFGDLGIVAGELEKLIAYTDGRSDICMDDVKSICSVRVEARVFEMIEFIAYKNKQKAFSLYFDMIAAREAPIKIFILLERHFYGLLQVSASPGMNTGELAKSMGVPPFVAGKYLKQVRGFTTERLNELVKVFIRTEEDIKTGRLSDRTGCELMIAEALL